MKNVLLLGRLGVNIPDFQSGVTTQKINLLSGTNLEDVKNSFTQNGPIDLVIMGAGLDLEDRLAIIQYIFETSKSTTVHMKDWNSGPSGMLPFVNGVLDGLIQ